METFIDVIGFEGLYRIGNFGTVIGIKRQITHKDGRVVNVKETVLKPFTKKNGYKEVKLSAGDKQKHYLVHRLVGLHFVPNSVPTLKTCVNHKDHNRANNVCSNLEWSTPSENNYHSKRWAS